jgi:SAM-dependent methyltransferase
VTSNGRQTPSGPEPSDLATLGFGSRSDVYERGRPGYPEEFLRLLVEVGGLGPRSRVLDLAAGTAKLTRQLARTGARCVAVEPSPTMRDVATQHLESVVGGHAEALPFTPSCFDLLTVAQAFHWFDATSAVPEMARVLRPGAPAVLVWNERDESVPFVAELGAIMDRVEGSVHAPASAFEPAFGAGGHFGPVRRHTFTLRVPMTSEEVVDLVASRSYVNVLAEPDRQHLLAEVRTLATKTVQPVMMAYRTEVLVAHRLAPAEP